MSPFSILLVEDDFDVREALVETLAIAGTRSSRPATVDQALQLLRGGARPGVILLDLMMPRMDGVGVPHGAAGRSQLADLPVVLLSADGRMEEKAVALKVQGAIRKPIDLDQLFSVIERMRSDGAAAGGAAASKTDA